MAAEKIAYTLHPEKLDNVPEWRAVEVADDIVVEEKYQGNTVDQSEMRMLGRIQVLRVKGPPSSPHSLSSRSTTDYFTTHSETSTFFPS